jgi:uncharacterized protein
MATMKTNIEVLYVDECLRLLGSHTVKLGRVGFDSDDGLIILPVNYRLWGGSIVFRTDGGSKLTAVLDQRPLAFEVDDVQPAWKEGWSVLVQGHGRLVEDPDEVQAITDTGLVAWGGADDHIIEIQSGRITGRRLS